MVTEKDIKRLAALAKLEVDEEKMLIYLNEMKDKLLIEESQREGSAFEAFCKLREDEALPSFSQNDILSNTAPQEDGFFKLEKRA